MIRGPVCSWRKKANGASYAANAALGKVNLHGAAVQFESPPLHRAGGMETCFPESHAAATKHTVITIEKTMGRIKRYLQLTTVMAAKQRASAHTVTRMDAKVATGRPPSCHANTAVNR